MFILLVSMHAKPEQREAFIAAITEDATASVRDEPGCLRFDVMQDNDDPNLFHLTEVYRDEAVFEAHTRTPHLLRWREASEVVLDKPTVAHRCTNIHPADDGW